jgi:hypothetical protein
MASLRYDLSTGLARLGPGRTAFEGHILRNFRKYAYRGASPNDSVWSWMAVGQHHGLPTRLLDWTYSPYVALHFATADMDRFHEDGVILCVDFVETHRLLPEPLRRALDAEGSNTFTVEMLARVAPTLAELDGLAGKPGVGRDFALFLEPPSLDDRIINQFALFSLMSSAAAQLDAWLAAHDEVARRIIIPAQLKGEVRDKLDQANITERVLLPGLDGLSRWLARHYSEAPHRR